MGTSNECKKPRIPEPQLASPLWNESQTTGHRAAPSVHMGQFSREISLHDVAMVRLFSTRQIFMQTYAHPQHGIGTHPIDHHLTADYINVAVTSVDSVLFSPPMAPLPCPPQLYHPLRAVSAGLSSGRSRTFPTTMRDSTNGLSPGHIQLMQSRSLLRMQHQRMIAARMDRDNSLARSGCNAARLPVAPGLPTMGPIARRPPFILAQPVDALVMSGHQAFLRQQIEIFEATGDDLTDQIRGRNKPTQLGQVGIRCRHCAHVSAACRRKATVYFPGELLGLYQAAQNMSSNHIQCGLCPNMPESLKEKFKELIPTKNKSSIPGRLYWPRVPRRLVCATQKMVSDLWAPIECSLDLEGSLSV